MEDRKVNRLEDIVSAEELRLMLCRNESEVSSDELIAKKANPEYSQGIMKMIGEYMNTHISNDPLLLMMIVMEPERVLCGITRALILCIDDAIKRKGDIKELDKLSSL